MWRLTVRRMCFYLLAMLGATLAAGVGPALAQRTEEPGRPAVKGEQSNTAFRVYSCGGGFTALSVTVSTHGNILQFSSPAGVTNIGSGRTGFGLCTTGLGIDPDYYDFDGLEVGWAAGAPIVSEPNGVGRFPLRITRTTSDGAYTVLREFSGNSFYMTVAGGGANDLNGNNRLCDTLAECGNCTNRTIHVMTRITKNTGGSQFVQIIEAVDFDAGSNPVNTWAHTSESVLAFESKAATDSIDATNYGMLLQPIILPSNPSKYPFGSGNFPGDCLGGTLGTDGTVVGDYEAYLRTPFGTLGGGGNTGNSIRVHYRRY